MNQEQTILFEKAKQRMKAAKALIDIGFYDDAISRAYYAMFNLARIFLLEKGLTYSKHSAVISAFGQHFAKTGVAPVEFHRYLNEAQNGRIISDYRFDFSHTEENALEILEQAEKFYRFTAEYFNKKINNK